MQPMFDKKQQTFSLSIDENTPPMNSDSGKIRQVLFNLLSNAVKYTPDQGAIGLEAVPLDSAQRVRLVVWDTGPGINEEDQLRIFEKFQQLDASVTREYSGAGLGLPISSDLCTLLGGTIRVESRPGSGARFIVELPIECPENVTLPLPTLT
jgi:signal transduction histidine kinase